MGRLDRFGQVVRSERKRRVEVLQSQWFCAEGLRDRLSLLRGAGRDRNWDGTVLMKRV